MITKAQYSDIRFLWKSFDRRKKKAYILLIIFMVLSSFAEVLSIGAMVPFLSALIDPSILDKSQVLKKILLKLSIENINIVLVLSMAFASSVLISGLFRLFVLTFSHKISFSVTIELGKKIFEKTLRQPYLTHINRNSSEIISTISIKLDNVVHKIISPITALLSGTIMVVFVISFLSFINLQATIIVFGGVGLFYYLAIAFSKKKLNEYSDEISHSSNRVIQLVTESLNGIRDVILDRSFNAHIKKFIYAESSLRNAQQNSSIIAIVPRYLVEIISILVIVLYLCYEIYFQKKIISSLIPVIGVLAISAQRLLPVMQQIFSSITLVRAGESSLRDVINLLKQEEFIIQEAGSINFKDSISLNAISYCYGKNNYLLKDININLACGLRIGILGETGSGKSTLFDLIMGFIVPSQGEVIIDGVVLTPKNISDWHSKIAHVPQDIFIIDGTIEENIIMTEDKTKINRKNLNLAVEIAELTETVKAMPMGLETIVGERGSLLSGGQRQRLGIARAVYKNPEVLFLDEATSAIDYETETRVVRNILEKSGVSTILMIAHRLETLSSCDLILRIAKNRVQQVSKNQVLNLKK
jgi:ABC-type bacteriocin/lantibiotic exporter with double-glycine peptidase domain